jgi:ubiquitin-protein ligase E3 C
MFQSFSGNSRRPRQVNLSGHQPDPFSAWGASPTASGTQKTVAVAQAERQLRQQERERLNATKQIQRTWRGHKSRKDLANIRRQEWDESQNGHTRQGKQRSLTLNEELRLLLSFFNAENPEDISRLSNFGERLLQASQEGCLKESDIRPQLLQLAHSITTALLG